jgi:pimeloyl-ACP methyl ester carboxylesterase
MHFACVEGAGHGTWRDRPEAALALLRDFITAPR